MHFSFQSPAEMLKFVYNTTDKSKNKKFINGIRSGFSDLKYKNKKISDDD